MGCMGIMPLASHVGYCLGFEAAALEQLWQRFSRVGQVVLDGTEKDSASCLTRDRL